MRMRIVIPTRGRIAKQRTFHWLLSPELRKMTDLVCPDREAEAHRSWRNDVNVVVQPDRDMTITKKREWIMRHYAAQGYERIVMLDDDLEWFVRKTPGDWHLRQVTAADMEYWFAEMWAKLSEEIPHAGFGIRQGNNTEDEGWISPTRMIYTLGYHLPTVLRECEVGRIENREDMDITLQLLRKGYPNARINTICAGQGKYGMAGGCTGQRTVEQANADAHRLAELHKGYVRVVQKDYDTTVPRLEVVCSWAKALRDGLAARQQRGDVQAGADQATC